MKIILISLAGLILSACSNEGFYKGSDGEQIEGALQARKPDFRRCYENEIKNRVDKPSGIVKTKFTIGPDGNVRKASILSTSLHLPVTETCILDVIRSIQFQASRGGTGEVEVNYPFKFSP